jgi:hypothetical protein
MSSPPRDTRLPHVETAHPAVVEYRVGLFRYRLLPGLTLDICVGVEAENLFSLFIARPGDELRCCVALLMREVGLSDRCSLCDNLVAYEPYHVGRAPATSLAKELCKRNHAVQ